MGSEMCIRDSVNAIIEIKVTPKAETGFDETAKIVASFDNVDSVYLAASATFDLIAFVRGANIQEVSSFVAKQLSTLDSVVSTATHFVLTEYKKSGISFIDDCNEEQRSMEL